MENTTVFGGSLWIWVIFIGFTIISWLISHQLKSRFQKYSKIPTANGMTGRDVVEKMLRDNGVTGVKIGSVEAGLDVPRIREIIYLEDQEDTMCKKCQYIRHCKTRGCQVANYEIHQNVYKPIKVNCEVTKWMYHLIQTNLSEKQLEKLKQEYERRYLRHGK